MFCTYMEVTTIGMMLAESIVSYCRIFLGKFPGGGGGGGVNEESEVYGRGHATSES